jgi:hypothetical protein
MQMFNAEYLQEKWAPILDYSGMDQIKDAHRRSVTAILLENQERELREEREFLTEGPTVNTNTGANAGFSAGASSPVAGFDPVLISLIRRSMPNLIAYDLCGVQPMNGPTGLIFAMRSRYSNQTGTEAFFNEANSAFSGQNAALGLTDGFSGAAVGMGSTAQGGTNPSILDGSSQANNAAPGGSQYNVGQGMRTDDSEDLGTSGGGAFNEMAFSIEKVTVTAKSRALKAEYSLELAQDLKAIHGLNAEAELANILSTEILAEINREIIRTVYKIAKPGAQANTATAGTFDLDVDSNGRWSVEKFKGLIFQIERDANAIAQQTRRGKGNMILCSADVASALTRWLVCSTTPQHSTLILTLMTPAILLLVFCKVSISVYIDPYSANGAAQQFYVVGYKGSSPYDAGLFYCPYVPLQMVRAVGENTFQPKIGFKTRYGIVANPFAEGTTAGSWRTSQPTLTAYYRRVKVSNLM